MHWRNPARMTIGVTALFLALLLGAFTVPLASAQLTQNDISASLSPDIPGPFENATITLSSYTVDIDKALIVWIVNGKEAARGVGEKRYALRTGGVGSSTSVTAKIYIGDILALEKSFRIEPAQVDIIWEAVDSYTPPFYKGKALPSMESRITVAAFPDVRTGGSVSRDSGDFVFNWSRNYKAVRDASGYGKNSYTFRSSYLNTKETVSVDISSIDDNYQASRRFSIPVGEPVILFYEKSPSDGILYEKALQGRLAMSGDEATIVAEPFFFSVDSHNASDRNLEYSWNINNSAVSGGSPKNSITLRKTGDQQGSTTLRVSLEHAIRLFQEAESSIRIQL